jgi:hypothetical protein
MPLLYKFLPPQDARLVLSTCTLSATDPRNFNDPFEVRPWFDQARHDHFARGHEAFSQVLDGDSHSLIAGGSMEGVPTETVIDFGEILNQRFRDDLERKFRALCLTPSPGNVLMWGHYTQSYRGIVLGIETSTPGFPQGMNADGFAIEYSSDRSRNKLPMAYYQFPPVEYFDLAGATVNRDDEPVESDGGIVIPFREYARQVEEAQLRALTTKAFDWSYEREVRFIYRLPEHSSQLIQKHNLTLVSIPKAAIREIIIGFRAEIALVENIVRLVRDGGVGTPKLFFTSCHPNQFEVEAHETDADYLLFHFQDVLPTR